MQLVEFRCVASLLSSSSSSLYSTDVASESEDHGALDSLRCSSFGKPPFVYPTIDSRCFAHTNLCPKGKIAKITLVLDSVRDMVSSERCDELGPGGNGLGAVADRGDNRDTVRGGMVMGDGPKRRIYRTLVELWSSHAGRTSDLIRGAQFRVCAHGPRPVPVRDRTSSYGGQFLCSVYRGGNKPPLTP